jgi:hypothetical protein
MTIIAIASSVIDDDRADTTEERRCKGGTLANGAAAQD